MILNTQEFLNLTFVVPCHKQCMPTLAPSCVWSIKTTDSFIISIISWKKYKYINRAIFVWPWNENKRTKQKQQTNGNRAILLVYQTDTNVRGFWLVKRTLGWKSITRENFLEINQYFALTSYCNTIGQSNNAFSILGFPLAGKRRVHILILSLPKPFFKVIRKSL